MLGVRKGEKDRQDKRKPGDVTFPGCIRAVKRQLLSVFLEIKVLVRELKGTSRVSADGGELRSHEVPQPGRDLRAWRLWQILLI